MFCSSGQELSSQRSSGCDTGDAGIRCFLWRPTARHVAAALLQGKSVEEYAEESAFSIKTARTHVKQIYSKVGVSRQSELVRVLLSSFGPLQRNNGER